MNAPDDSLAQYLTPRNYVDDENNWSHLQRSQTIIPMTITLDLEMSDQNEESNVEQSPPNPDRQRITRAHQTGKRNEKTACQNKSSQKEA